MNAYGNNLSLSIYGGSHDEEIGVRLSGFPAGFSLDVAALRAFLARRAPGSTPLGTKRKETDIPTFLSGLDEKDTTTGKEIHAVIKNETKRSSDYAFVYDTPRPGHADFVALQKYGDGVDLRGGGHFSGRLTAPLCVAGGICLQYLESKGIHIGAHITSVGDVKDTEFDTVTPDIALFEAIKLRPLTVIDEKRGEEMAEVIKKARSEGDSVGGTATCMVVGLPIGLGEHMFRGVEGRIASLLFSIPAVKGVEFGAGFRAATMRGSEHNDAYVTDGTHVTTKTNHAGGILGGMTNGMPLYFTVAVKPTPSIAKTQETVSLSRMENTTLQIGGRHDPCILPRIVPVLEAAAAIAVTDLLLDNEKAKANEPQTLDLSELRLEIDRIDTELVALFNARMEVSAKVAAYKRQTGMAVMDEAREAALLDRVAGLSPTKTANCTRTLYRHIMALSRAYQHQQLGVDSPFVKELVNTLKNEKSDFPTTAKVAYQGKPGAYSHAAAQKLFAVPTLHAYPTFADVFAAVADGTCQYGVLPIENSTAGSVTEIYDLMAKHRFYIVRDIRLPVTHCLLGKEGTALSEVTEIVSHRQALSQCDEFLKTLVGVKQTAMENTAVAAEYVAKTDGKIAAVASPECAALYGLHVLSSHIANTENNQTRFICIAKNPEFYKGAGKTSLICTLPHRQGSLSEVLTRFDALGANLTKLESRPIPEKEFEFRFYFDFLSENTEKTLPLLLAELSGEHEDFRYLGTYCEVE